MAKACRAGSLGLRKEGQNMDRVMISQLASKGNGRALSSQFGRCL